MPASDKRRNTTMPSDCEKPFSIFEKYLIGSWLYPIGAITAHIRLNKSRIAAEIFSVDGLMVGQELYINHSIYRAPTYVGVGGPYAMVPFGGGTSNEWIRVYSAFRNDLVKKLYWNYELVQSSKNSIKCAITYISKEAELAAVVPVAEHNRFPVSFPLQIREYKLSGGPLFFHAKTGLAGLTKKELLQQILINTRFFGTVGIPSVALLMFSIPWALHLIEVYNFSILYHNASPPTNIIAKIQHRLKSWSS